MKPNRLIELVASELQKSDALKPGALLIIAVSGGPDSLALLYALAQLREPLGLQLHVVHLNHQLRAEAAAEAQFVAEQAALLAIPATIIAQDVAAYAKQHGLNLYAAGRVARYTLFAHSAATQHATAVVVAHHANDQAETVLMHLLRGAGSTGLAGMQPQTPWAEWRAYCDLPLAEEPSRQPVLIRPLLRATRSEIEAFCEEQGLDPRRDPSNQDQRHLRSRVRQQLLPTLIEYNPAIIVALCRTAETTAAERDFLNRALDSYWPQLAEQYSAGVDLDLAVWATMHIALQRLALRRAYRVLGGSDTLGFDDLERVLAVIGNGVGRVIELPGGVLVRVGYHALHIGSAPTIDGPQLLEEQQLLPVPGTIALANGWRISAEHGIVPATTKAGWEAWFTSAEIQELIVRRRRIGDHFNQQGRSIQSIMISAKIPFALRHAWPLIINAERIIWVPMARALPKPAVGTSAICLRVKAPV